MAEQPPRAPAPADPPEPADAPADTGQADYGAAGGLADEAADEDD